MTLQTEVIEILNSDIGMRIDVAEEFCNRHALTIKYEESIGTPTPLIVEKILRLECIYRNVLLIDDLPVEYWEDEDEGV